MRNTKILVLIGSVAFLSLAVSAVAAPLEIVGTLQNTDGVSLSGRITVIQETPSLTFTHHEVDKTGLFEISIDDAQGALAKASDNNTVQAFRYKVLRELKKIKLAWPGLNYATAPGVLILHPSAPAIAPSDQGQLRAG